MNCNVALVTIFSIFALASLAHAQSVPSQPTASESASSSTTPTSRPPSRQMMLDVRVADKSGQPVQGLQQTDFTLLDNNHPQNIVSFAEIGAKAPAAGSPTPPVEVFIVVDAVNVPFTAVSYERNEIHNFLLQNGGQLSYLSTLLVFTGEGMKVVKTATRDGNALAEAWDQFQTGLREFNRSQGAYGAEDRFNRSLNAFHSLLGSVSANPGRKLLIWLSPGWPLLSGPRLEFSSQIYQQLFSMIVSDSDGIARADVTVYSVDPLGMADAGTNSYYKEFLKGVKTPSQSVPGDLALQVLAVQSGGSVASATNNLAPAITSFVAEADAYYILSFNTEPSEKPNEYHSLVIKIDKPGAVARTRTTYYAQP